MELIIDKKAKNGRLILTDELTINRIRQLRDDLDEAQGKVKNLMVDIEKATDIDLTFLQLLCSAHRSAVSQNKTLTLSGKINPAMEKAIRENHYLRQTGCIPDKTNTCLWMVIEHE